MSNDDSNLGGSIKHFPEIISRVSGLTQLLALIVLAVMVILVVLGTKGVEATALYVFAGILVLIVVGAIAKDILRPANEASPINVAPATDEMRFDVYIAAPMDGLSGAVTFEKHNVQINDIKDALRKFCKMETCFYAGTDIDNKDGFNAPHIALRENFRSLRQSKNFILFYPEKAPSSVLVEAGMALALGKPSTWFVRDDDDLPYLLRGGTGASGGDRLPPIRVHKYKSVEDVVRRLQTDREAFFS